MSGAPLAELNAGILAGVWAALCRREDASVPGLGVFSVRTRPGFGGAERCYVHFRPDASFISALGGGEPPGDPWIAGLAAQLRSVRVASLEPLGALQLGEEHSPLPGTREQRVPTFRPTTALRAAIGPVAGA